MPKKTVKSNNVVSTTGEEPKRLAPTPEALRELYLLSGNRCAMPGCPNLMIDGNGVVVGHICHIRSAMPDGARFDKYMTNEQRREVSNLLMMCGGHHTQIDSKQYEAHFTLTRVTKIKNDHEAKFKGIGTSLQKAFEDEYVDVTDKLDPSEALTFKRLESVLKDCRVEPEQAAERQKQIADHLDRMRLVPDAERNFMLAVIRRAMKLGARDGVIVSTDDLRSSLGLSVNKLKSMGTALKRYAIGDLDLAGKSGGDEYCVWIRDPSDYVTWFEINRFCEKAGIALEEFVLRLKFGLLDS